MENTHGKNMNGRYLRKNNGKQIRKNTEGNELNAILVTTEKDYVRIKPEEKKIQYA